MQKFSYSGGAEHSYFYRWHRSDSMGYCCPVCDVPQADGEHLANHLAITAMTHGEDHEDWLDEHAPGWADSGPEELAAIVVEHAEETEHETIFEDTTDRGPNGQRFEDALGQQLDRQGGGRGTLPPETDRIVEQARELTTEMQRTAADRSDDDSADD